VAYVEWLRCRTVSLLRSPLVWAQVEVLATALLERGDMSERRARELIRPVFGSPEARVLLNRAKELQAAFSAASRP
jgi:hypothetical protein